MLSVDEITVDLFKNMTDEVITCHSALWWQVQKTQKLKNHRKFEYDVCE